MIIKNERKTTKATQEQLNVKIGEKVDVNKMGNFSGLQAAILGYNDSMEQNYNLGWKKGYDVLMNFSYCEENFAVLADEAKQLLLEEQVPYTKGYAQGTIDAITQRCEQYMLLAACEEAYKFIVKQGYSPRYNADHNIIILDVLSAAIAKVSVKWHSAIQ